MIKAVCLRETRGVVCDGPTLLNTNSWFVLTQDVLCKAMCTLHVLFCEAVSQIFHKNSRKFTNVMWGCMQFCISIFFDIAQTRRLCTAQSCRSLLPGLLLFYTSLLLSLLSFSVSITALSILLWWMFSFKVTPSIYLPSTAITNWSCIC